MSKKVKFGAISLAVAIVFVILVNVIWSCSERKKVDLQQQIEILTEEFTPMAFEISKSSGEDIKLKVVFYDLDKKKVGSETIKLKGQELNFDFQVIKLNDSSFIFFPVGIYTELIAINDAVKVADFYNNKGFPDIYKGILDLEDEKGKKLDKASKLSIEENLKFYFNLAINGNNEFDTESHGVAVHDIKNVSQFKKGFIYEVICHPHTGGIEIVRK